MNDVQIIKSKRKTISLQIRSDGSIELKVPMQMSNVQIKKFLNQKCDWIDKHLQAVNERQRQMSQVKKLTKEEIHELADRALEVIPKRVAHFASLVGVTYGRITIRNQKTRWGSCSGKGNLNFNCLLMLMPAEVLDYVVVHELCHRKEMNHSPQFWAEVRKIMPDYEKQKSWLKDHCNEIMMKMIG